MSLSVSNHLGQVKCVVTAVAIAAAAAATTLHARPASRAEQGGQATQAPTIAVLPFENISGQPDDDWFGLGIAETVSADLQQVGTVSIFDVGATLPQDVARGLGISWVISGGYQRIGDQLRITARVLDVETGETQGAARVDGAMSDLFALQDQIVMELVNSVEQFSAARGPELLAPRGAETAQPPPRPDAPSPDTPPGVEEGRGRGGGRPAGLTPVPGPESPPSRPTSSAGRGFEVAVGTGASLPVSPAGFDELFDPGYSFSVDVTRQITGPVGWRAEFGLDRTSLVGADLNMDFTRYGGGITLAPFESSGRGTPYGFFTVGGFTNDARGADAPDRGAETDVGISFGGGYKWRVGDTWGVGGTLRVNGIFGGSSDEGGNDDAPLWYLSPSVVVFFRF